MSGRIFQNVVLQLKENTDRTVGVIDGEGVVIACSELSMIGQRWSEYVAAVNGAAGSMVCFDGKTFKALSGWGNQFDYAVFAFGDNEISKTICSMATVALNAAKSYYEEKHDRGSFVKDIISDNIMLGDIYMRAKELRVATDVSRGIFAVRALQKGESVPTETIQAMFPDRQNDFVLSVGEGDVVLIRQLPDGYQMELNEDASNVSQGQKQLLTIARAILADNRVMILDEATSSVDTRTEILIQKAMDHLMEGRTSFIIAHRLSTIRNADMILVMKDGDIIEQGTHDELLAKNGFYADLYRSQFAQTA